MCGRYFIDSDILCSFEQADDTTQNVERLEIAPGSEPLALIVEHGKVVSRHMRWGFEGPKGGLIINARAETIRQKPMFSALAERQRCALPATGYFEWRKADRQKFAIACENKKLFYLAGLYRYGANGLECVVLTQPPLPEIERIHNRMPVILPDESALKRWLSGAPLEYPTVDHLTIAAEGDEQLQMSLF